MTENKDKWYKYKSNEVSQLLALVIVLPFILRMMSSLSWEAIAVVITSSVIALMVLKKFGIKIH